MPNEPRLARFLETAGSVLNYFEPFLGRIEILGGSKRIERVYFEIKESNIEQWEKPQIKVWLLNIFCNVVVVLSKIIILLRLPSDKEFMVTDTRGLSGAKFNFCFFVQLIGDVSELVVFFVFFYTNQKLTNQGQDEICLCNPISNTLAPAMFGPLNRLIHTYAQPCIVGTFQCTIIFAFYRNGEVSCVSIHLFECSLLVSSNKSHYN